jgi:hypothetical protein
MLFARRKVLLVLLSGVGLAGAILYRQIIEATKFVSLESVPIAADSQEVLQHSGEQHYLQLADNAALSRSPAIQYSGGVAPMQQIAAADDSETLETWLRTSGVFIGLAAESFSMDDLRERLGSLGFKWTERNAGNPLTGKRVEWTGAHPNGGALQAQFFMDESGHSYFDSLTVTFPMGKGGSSKAPSIRALREDGGLEDPSLLPVRSSEHHAVYSADARHRTFWIQEDPDLQTVQITLEHTECEHGVASHEH